MHEPRTCHLPNHTALFCIGVDRFGLAEAPQHNSTDITELGGRR